MIELVVNFYSLNVAELFQVQCDQVSDGKVFAACDARPFEMDMRDIANDFKFGEPCKTVIQRGVSPSVFCCAGTFEIFLQNAFGQVG